MKRPPKLLSPARRIARAMVWITFCAVVLVRFVFFREEFQPVFPERLGWQQQQGQRFRRPPTPIAPPMFEVPKDLPRLQIEIARKDVEVLRGYVWNGWRGGVSQERPQVKVTVREGDRTYTNVALHLKGAAGSFREFDDKPALTLNFAKHAPGQRFHGYSKLSLNNSVQDPTYLCEAVCRELYNAVGVPAPRADWATVLINGRDLGLYVMVEGYNKDFLRRHFKNVKGNLYDGGFVQDVHPNLNVNSGDHPEDRSDIRRLLAAASERDPDLRWERLQEVLDMERFITLIAMEVMMCHWDGYAMNRNNYRLFHDLDSGKMIFMPHGLDQMFDFPPGRFPASGSIHPRINGLLANAVLNTRQGGQWYMERLASLRTNTFHEDAVAARVRELAQRIRPTLAAYNPSIAQWHDTAVESLCDRISQRIHSVSDQLDRPRQTLEFDANGIAPLTEWTERFNTQGSALRLDTVEDNGKTLLRISAQNRGGTGSWRSRVQLGAGQYRFEGRAKLSPSAAGSHLALRISGSRTAPQTVTSTDWVPLSFLFTVGGYLREVVLVCEFSGARGEAWFDVDSLQLVRE